MQGLRTIKEGNRKSLLDATENYLETIGVASNEVSTLTLIECLLRWLLGRHAGNREYCRKRTKG